MKLFFPKPPRQPAVSLHRRIRQLEIVTSKLVREGFAGQYHSAFHGRGLEFSQVREYQPGDDVRTIDWNVTARTGLPHVKQFVEERDLTILLALDISPSMSFGSIDRRKSEVAAELVSVLSYSALKNHDRVGLVTFSDKVHRFVTPKRGRAQVTAVTRAALVATPTGTRTTFVPLERFLHNVLRRRSVLIVLSDFLDATGGRELTRLGERHDVVAMRITDPREAILPRQGLVRLRDAEHGHRITIDLADPLPHSEMQRRRARLDSELRRAQIDTVEISTVTPYERPLVDFFQRRLKRIR